MNTPYKIYLHETIDAESGQHLGYEWHPQRVSVNDVCYIRETISERHTRGRIKPTIGENIYIVGRTLFHDKDRADMFAKDMVSEELPDIPVYEYQLTNIVHYEKPE